MYEVYPVCRGGRMEVDRECLLILEVSRVTCERRDFSFYDAILVIEDYIIRKDGQLLFP
jgi:hypothetical protein